MVRALGEVASVSEISRNAAGKNVSSLLRQLAGALCNGRFWIVDAELF